jgi:hypothetical protein
MIDDMPKPRPPSLHRQVTRHGRAVWYVRLGKGPRVRMRADFGTVEFNREYQAAIAGASKTMVKSPEINFIPSPTQDPPSPLEKSNDFSYLF